MEDLIVAGAVGGSFVEPERVVRESNGEVASINLRFGRLDIVRVQSA